jgi:hypothetical protein
MRSATTRGWWSASARAPTASAATTTTSSSPWDVSTGLDRILCSLYVTQFENMGLGVGELSYCFCLHDGLGPIYLGSTRLGPGTYFRSLVDD